MTPWVDPEMAVLIERLRAAPPLDYKTMPIAEAREKADAGTIPWSAGAPDMPTEELSIPRPAGTMRARLYRPLGGADGRLTIWAHGGGWTFGSIDTHDGTMRNFAEKLGSPVLGIDYRLAPEHPFPAGLDDTLMAIAFVEGGGLGTPIPAERIAVAGDSAGANLALAALIARRDAGLRTLAGAALYYGCYAPDFSTGSHAAFGDGPYLLTTVNMRWYWRSFLGDLPDETTSLAAPLRAELSGLPPLYLAAAGLDPLRDDTLLIAARLAAAGVDFRCDHVPGVVHGCLRMTRELGAARRMIAAGAGFVAERLNENTLGGSSSWNAALS
jgi:acetyl esterase